MTLIGNLGENPEFKELNGGKRVANFSLATNETYGKGDDKKPTHNGILALPGEILLPT